MNELAKSEKFTQKIITQELTTPQCNFEIQCIDISLKLPRLLKRGLNAFYQLRGLAHNTNYPFAKKVIEKYQPDIIHCHFGTAGYFNYYLQKYSNTSTPVVVSFHGYDVFEMNSLFKKYKDSLVKLIDGNCLCTCPSEFLKLEIIKRFGIDPRKVIVIPNGFNADLFSLSNTKVIRSSKYKLLHIGRFVELKGHKYLIEAINLIIKRGFKDIELCLIGDGENISEHKKLVKSLGLQNFIKFTGSLSHREVAKLMSECDLYVHPSYTLPCGKAETFGIAILEALACGKPAVITDSGGMKEIAPKSNDNFLKVVPQKSVESLANAIQQFIVERPHFNNQEFRKFREEVLNQNNLQRNAALLEKVYNSLLA
jgi:glycosyltransferase involved in cell wall biosynthesis